jgi:hypothetical protein
MLPLQVSPRVYRNTALKNCFCVGPNGEPRQPADSSTARRNNSPALFSTGLSPKNVRRAALCQRSFAKLKRARTGGCCFTLRREKGFSWHTFWTGSAEMEPLK